MKSASNQKSNPYLLSTALILIGLGLVAVTTASAVVSYDRFGHNHYYSFRQMIFAATAIVAMVIMSRIDYHVWKKWSRPLMLLAFILLAVVLIPGIGFSPVSARSWFRVGSFLVQPSEFAKLALIFYLASWFERKKAAEENFFYGILPPLFVSGILLALVVLEPDVGTATVIAMIVMFVFVAAGVRWRYVAAIIIAGLAGLWIMIKAAPYRAARIVTFLDPSVDPQGIGYHINQALLAIGSGGIWGYGFGASKQKHNFLPEPIGDSIFAIMAEELGFLRVIIILALFGALIFTGLKVAKQAPDKFGYLTAAGIVGWIGLQAFVNIGAISGLLPLTGITLPFISYGGSSLLAVSAAIGVLLNISKQR